MVVIVIGVSASGKSTLARALADALGCDFVEADDFHPPANIAKMSRGIPLEDEDRWPWLDSLNAALRWHVANARDVVLACSALKEVYRQRLRLGVESPWFVHLHADADLLRRRLARRRDHFMPPELLASQLATLEPPTDAVVVDAAQSLETQVALVRRTLGR